MSVKRIVVNVAAESVASVATVKQFYAELFGLDLVMDQGWVVTLASGNTAPAQMSIASEGGSGTAVPDISIEVDNVDALYARSKQLGHKIEYALTDEPWGVRRFYLRDPVGKLLNVLSHSSCD